MNSEGLLLPSELFLYRLHHDFFRKTPNLFRIHVQNAKLFLLLLLLLCSLAMLLPAMLQPFCDASPSYDRDQHHLIFTKMASALLPLPASNALFHQNGSIPTNATKIALQRSFLTPSFNLIIETTPQLI